MIKYLTKEELKGLLKVIKDPRDRAIWTVSYWRGLRASEPGTIRLTAFTRDTERPELGRLAFERKKNSLPGNALLSPDETKAIKAWLKVRGTKPGVLFPSNRGKGISRQQIDKLMRHYGKLANLPDDKRHFHVLKHSICTHLRQAGLDLLEIKEWVGHRNVNSTVQYTHIVDAKRDQAALRVFDEW